MLVILDYDQTYTQDPAFWLSFVKALKERGHAVICCTMRYEVEVPDMCPKLRKHVTVVPTSRMAKRPFLLAKGYDLTTAVWVDDSPHWIFENAC